MKLIYLGSAIIPFLTFSLPAIAASVSFTGDLTGAPEFDSPNVGNPPTSTDGNDTFPYVSQPFFVSNSGSYDFSSQTTGSSWDNSTILYSNSFDPANPLTNAVIAAYFSTNGSVITSGFDNINLTANTQYFFVTTAYSPSEGYGTFDNTISSDFSTTADDITLGLLPTTTPTDVPEPTTFPATLLFISGAAVLWKTRRRQF